MMIISISLALYISQSAFVIIPFDSLKDIMRYMSLSLVPACKYVYLKMSRCQFIIAAWRLFNAAQGKGKFTAKLKLSLSIRIFSLSYLTIRYVTG